MLLLLPLEGTGVEAWRALKHDDGMRLDFMYENTYELVRVPLPAVACRSLPFLTVPYRSLPYELVHVRGRDIAGAGRGGSGAVAGACALRSLGPCNRHARPATRCRHAAATRPGRSPPPERRR